MRTTIELSDRTYALLRARAAERGMRGFSAIVEDALERVLCDDGGENDLLASLVAAEGSWSTEDVEEWERAREEAWATWPANRSSSRAHRSLRARRWP